MIYYRCQCGAVTSWGSMSPPQCTGCEKCGTSLASAPEHHHKPTDHRWVGQEVETDEGPKILTHCMYCHRTRLEIEKKQ